VLNIVFFKWGGEGLVGDLWVLCSELGFSQVSLYY